MQSSREAAAAPMLTPSSGGSFQDNQGNTWTLTSDGSVQENGQDVPGGGGTSALTYVNGTVYGQDANSGSWYAWADGTWTGPQASPVSSGGGNSASGTSSSGTFHVANGTIYAPDGSVYRAKGINVSDGEMGSANAILAQYTGLNFVRFNAFNYWDPSAYADFITTMTTAGVVVEIENHQNFNADGSNAGFSGGAQGVVFTGDLLSAESNWYAALAAAYKDNPYVWYGTNNEPPEDGGSLTAWHQATYAAVRNAGASCPIMVDPWGAYISGGDGWNKAAYLAMSNIVLDVHDYPWYASNGQISQTQGVTQIASDAQTGGGDPNGGMTSADGTVPVIMGEFGPNDGSGAAGGQELINAVMTAVANNQLSGCAAWHWGSGYGDDLNNADGSLSEYGQTVVDWMSSTAGTIGGGGTSNGGTGVVNSGPAVLTAGGGGSLTDNAGNTWTLTADGSVQENGNDIPGGGGTAKLTYVSGTIYGQDAKSGDWYAYANGQWTGPQSSPIPGN